MKLSLTLAAALAAAGLTLAAATLQDKGKLDAAATGMSGPGPEHKVLELWAGDWDATVTVDMGGPKPDVSQATYSARVGLGGLWLTGEFKGQFMGQPFEGRDVLGYDSGKKSYVGTWIDSGSPSLSVSSGTWDAASQTLTMRGTGLDPATGKEMGSVMKTSFRGADRMLLSLQMDGAPAPMMTIEYKRMK